jgi:hypothetical protein
MQNDEAREKWKKNHDEYLRTLKSIREEQYRKGREDFRRQQNVAASQWNAMHDPVTLEKINKRKDEIARATFNDPTEAGLSKAERQQREFSNFTRAASEVMAEVRMAAENQTDKIQSDKPVMDKVKLASASSEKPANKSNTIFFSLPPEVNDYFLQQCKKRSGK